jgi:uncharacterized protein YbcI
MCPGPWPPSAGRSDRPTRAVLTKAERVLAQSGTQADVQMTREPQSRMNIVAATSVILGIHTEYLGRGPRTASTFHYGNVLVTLMHEVLTHAEKSLTRRDHEAVNCIRHLSQGTMRRTSAPRSSG